LPVRELAFNTNQHTAPCRAMITIVEKRDVPPSFEPVQELGQRTRTLRELEPVQQLRFFAMASAANHVPDMELGSFIVGHVGNRVALLLQPEKKFFAICRVRDLNADVDVSRVAPRVAARQPLPVLKCGADGRS